MISDLSISTDNQTQHTPGESPFQPSRVTKWTRSHPIDLIIGDKYTGVQIRTKATSNVCLFVNFVSLIKPKKIDEALQDADWISAMQEELEQFER